MAPNNCIHQTGRSVTGLAGASPAPARPAGDACVRRLEGKWRFSKS
jgi:hypothetical protein